MKEIERVVCSSEQADSLLDATKWFEKEIRNQRDELLKDEDAESRM